MDLTLWSSFRELLTSCASPAAVAGVESKFVLFVFIEFFSKCIASTDAGAVLWFSCFERSVVWALSCRVGAPRAESRAVSRDVSWHPLLRAYESIVLVLLALVGMAKALPDGCGKKSSKWFKAMVNFVSFPKLSKILSKKWFDVKEGGNNWYPTKLFTYKLSFWK